MESFRRRRVVLPRRSSVALPPAPGSILVMMQVFHLPVHADILVALMVDRIENLLFIVLKIGGWEARVDILRNHTELLISAGDNIGEIRLFERPVLVQGTTDEVGAVR